MLVIEVMRVHDVYKDLTKRADVSRLSRQLPENPGTIKYEFDSEKRKRIAREMKEYFGFSHGNSKKQLKKKRKRKKA